MAGLNYYDCFSEAASHHSLPVSYDTMAIFGSDWFQRDTSSPQAMPLVPQCSQGWSQSGLGFKWTQCGWGLGKQQMFGVLYNHFIINENNLWRNGMLTEFDQQ